MRSLSFEEREVIQAIVDLTRRMRQPLPVGQIVGVDLHTGPISADLIIEDDYGERTRVSRTDAELAASLVHFCIDRHIRLPTRGRKFVEIIGGHVNLVIFMDGEGAVSSKSRSWAGRRATAGH